MSNVETPGVIFKSAKPYQYSQVTPSYELLLSLQLQYKLREPSHGYASSGFLLAFSSLYR